MKMYEIIKKNKILAVVSLVYIFLLITMPDKAYLSVKNSMYYVIEMIEIMPVIFILTAIIEVWVPKEVIMSSFGVESGLKGNVFSFLLGSFSAGPIYAAFPVCKMLLKKGASINNIVIILSAWAVIKVPMLANEAKFLGVKFMVTRWLFTVVAIVAMSYIVTLFVKKENIPVYQDVDINRITGVNVKEQYCVGCGLCERLSPEDFKVNDKKAKWKKSTLDYQKLKELKSVIEKCPVKAIEFQ